MNRLSTPDELAAEFPNGPIRKPVPEPKSPIPYEVQYWASVFVTIALLITGAIQVADPTTLGLSPVVGKWVGVATMVLSGIGGFLPKLQSPPDGRP